MLRNPAIQSGYSCEYSYYVVDDEGNVLRWETGKKHKLLLPEGTEDGDCFQKFLLLKHNNWVEEKNCSCVRKKHSAVRMQNHLGKF